ncbi:reverse transcriptase domain-containing protein [Tanacetum coccineum]
MVNEGNCSSGHKSFQSQDFEVDRAKVEVIAKLLQCPSPPTTVKVTEFPWAQELGVFTNDSFRTSQKLPRPMTHLLEKETPFFFSEECDFAIGAVLGQRKNKHFQPIHYASKTMNEAQTHYTTTEKELLAVVYAFEKFRSYLVMSKSIVYTDHSAIKYLFAKKDAKARLMRSVPDQREKTFVLFGEEALDILKLAKEARSGEVQTKHQILSILEEGDDSDFPLTQGNGVGFQTEDHRSVGCYILLGRRGLGTDN